MTAKLLGNQSPVTSKIAEVTQGIGFEQLEVDESTSGTGLENPVAFIDYQTGIPNPGYVEGRTFYDDEKHAVSYYNSISDTTVNLAQEQILEVCNQTGVTITNGQAVRVITSLAGHPCVVLSQSDTVANASVAGVATHDIPDGTNGFITIFGQVGSLDTSMFSEGDRLYISETTPGLLVNIEQQILSPVAIVLTSDPTDGQIVVSPIGVINLTAIGQVAKESGAVTQAITATPVELAVFANAAVPAVNITPTFTAGSGQFEAKFSPDSPGASGFYEVTLAVSGSSTTTVDNTVFTLNINGSPTPLFTEIPFDNLVPGDIGSASMSGFTETVISDTDELEIFISSVTSSTFTCTSCFFTVKRLGNA